MRFFWHFDHYTLNIYQSKEYFTYFCVVSRRCQDERQSNAEIYIDYQKIHLTNVGKETTKRLKFEYDAS